MAAVRVLGTFTVVALTMLVAASTSAATPLDPQDVVDTIEGATGQEVPATGTPADDWTQGNSDGADAPAEDPAAGDPGLGADLRDALMGPLTLVGFAGLLTAALGVTGFALVTRYVSPKEALKNPQRSMLYGFVMATPGVHLKKLSDEFGMKSSSILWHMRKLEAADLVRSEQVGGYRVFHPTEGGVAARELGRAVAAIQNRNAAAILDAIASRPGANTNDLARGLALSAGNVRWHVRRLRDAGLLEELVRSDERTIFATPLGSNALEATQGRATSPQSNARKHSGHDAAGFPLSVSAFSQKPSPAQE